MPDRHEDSESEGEPEAGYRLCQADQIAMDQKERTVPLATEPCRDQSRGEDVPLLKADEAISCHEGLGVRDDGARTFHSCDYHRAVYQASLRGRACSVDGCRNQALEARHGVRLCKLHAAKGEKPAAQAAEARRRPRLPAEEAPPPPEKPQAILAAVLKRLLSQEALEDAVSLTAAERGLSDDLGEAPDYLWELLRSTAEGYLSSEEHGLSSEVVRALRAVAGGKKAADPVLALGASIPYGGRSQLGHCPLEEKGEPPEPRDGPSPDPVPAPWEALSHAKSSKEEVAASLFRKRGRGQTPGSRLHPGEPHGWMPGGEALRPFQVGAYTDVLPHHSDDATKALQAIAKAFVARDEAAGQERGKLSAIGKVEERLVFLVRGCDTLTVPMGEATVGKELFHALRSIATQSRPLLRGMKFPVNITNRFAFGVASMTIGGKGAAPDFALTAGDFPQTSEEDFDLYVLPSDTKLEKRPRAPVTLSVWFRDALRQSWAVACVYGTEHYPSWEKAAAHLLKLGEEYAHAWPLSAVMAAWDELWSRFTEEIRELERRARREMSEEAPSFERLRFFSTAPGADGDPWLRLPRTFDLDDEGEYFCTDVLPRQRRQLERACWQLALRKGPSAGGRAGELEAEDDSRVAATPGVGPAHPSPLLGKALTAKEVSRSLDHRPKFGQKYMCWDFMSRRGCQTPNCPHSHEGGLPKWSSLDYTVQQQLLRRGGHRGQPKPTGVGDIDRQIEALRAAQADKLSKAVAEGKAQAKAKAAKAKPKPKQAKRVGADDEAQDSTRAGWAAPPPELGSFYATDQESGLAQLMAGSAPTWTVDVSPPPSRMAPEPTDGDSQSRMERMREIDGMHLVTGMGDLLSTYIRNRLLRVVGTPQPSDVQEALDDARTKGCPELAIEAETYLSKVGSLQMCAQLPDVSWPSGSPGPGETTLTWQGYTWAVYDYGDALPCSRARAEPGEPHTALEPRQCLVLHLAAALHWLSSKEVPTHAEVLAASQDLRDWLIEEASAALDALGPLPDVLSRAEDDLRVFSHDVLHFGHDKDYRSIAAFPPPALEQRQLVIVRLDGWRRPTFEVIRGVCAMADKAPTAWLLVADGHMRFLVPHQPLLLESLAVSFRVVQAAGWQVHFEAAAAQSIGLPGVKPTACPRCAQEDLRRTGVSTSVLGLYPLVAPLGAPGRSGGSWEAKTPELSLETPADLLPYFSAQAEAFAAVLEHGLDFLEVYAGTARASAAVRRRGGTALTIGLDHGHDLTRGADRAHLLAALSLLQPRHLWVSFPCTAFCGWARLNALRSPAYADSLRLGRQHLRFAMTLVVAQKARGGHAHVENPLTSAAWHEPPLVAAFQGDGRVRFDQCAFGLQAADGTLHFKPTLVRSTDPAMLAALDRRCSGQHSHSLVQGAATAPSAMYPPKLATAISRVVVPEAGSRPGRASGVGGGTRFHKARGRNQKEKRAKGSVSFLPKLPSPSASGRWPSRAHRRSRKRLGCTSAK